MFYKILTLDDNFEWLAFLEKLDEKDVYFTPQYSRIFKNYGDGEPRLYIHQSDYGIVFYPFLFRSISSLKFSKGNYKNYFDITTPYGYGGPLIKCSIDKYKNLVEEFRKSFDKYCDKNQIVTEFIRFHPVIRNHQVFLSAAAPNTEIKHIRDTVMIDLSQTEKEIWENYEGRNRTSIRLAQKKGLEVNFHSKETLSKAMEEFSQLYYLTIKRRNAKDYYFFPKFIFNDTIKYLNENVEIALVKYQNKVIAASIFMFMNKYVHYHLSGSDFEFHKYAPNNFLLHSAILRYKKMRYKYFHLGGGYSDADSLFKFKKSFTKLKEAILPFYVGMAIHNQVVYYRLNKTRKDYLASKQNKGEVESNYFPLYRAPLIDQLNN